ncbi:hypothetical protein BC827DRAFT_1268087 [Russula dissimulans]|nr:hypothetical protein BC827DRAFT_1268087 [Russula dissimulans]
MDSSSDNDGPKRPKAVRPLPRPLLSGGPPRNGSSSDDFTSPRSHSRTPSNATEPTADSPPAGDTRGVFLAGATITESPISSPTLHDGQRSNSPSPSPFASRGPLSRSRPVKKSSLLSSRSSSASDLAATDEPSQSKRRWDDLRRHFLPAHLPPRAAGAQPSPPPPPISDAPQRPSTPKQFRLPKLGFKQVVEQAQDLVVDQNKREREGTLATISTSLNMGFMGPNASLGVASASASSFLPSSRGWAMRRPPSLHSVASHSHPPLAALTSLCAIISYHASSAPNQLQAAQSLPHENEVLSALLVPFVTPWSKTANSDRLQALEGFEIIVRTWQPASDEHYGVQLRNEADALAVIDCVVIMALGACTEHAVIGEHQHILNNVVDAKESWFSATSPSHFSPSLLRIEAQSISQCSHALSKFLLSSDGVRPTAEDSHLVLRILTEWSIPAAHTLVHDGSFDCKVMCARLALSLLSLSIKEIGSIVASFIENWYRDHSQWISAFETAIPIVVRENSWEVVVATLLALMDQLPDELRSPAAAKFLPALNEKLVLEPPPLPFSAFTELLEIASQSFPKVFYKPLFACAAGTKVSSIVNHLRTISMLARHLPSFWIRDAEMLLVALMSDSGNTERDPQDDARPSWGQVRLGQLVILTELIAHVQATRQDKDGGGPSSSTFLARARFFFELERRLGAFIVTKVSCVFHLSVFINQPSPKERMLLIPVPQRILLVILFLEIRLLVRSLKPAQWLSSVISWALSSEEDIQVAQNDTRSILATFNEIYSALQQWSFVSQKRNGPLTPTGLADVISTTAGSLSTDLPSPLTFPSREPQLRGFSKGLITNSLRLLVAVSGLLSPEDHESLCGFLWQSCLTQAPYEIQTSATFLFMQCAENAPTTTLDVVQADIRSPQASRRLLAGRRLSLIAGWRFQMLSQDYIVDKNHRRPFKLVRVPMAFLPTDVGSSSFIFREDLVKGNLASGRVLPLELRKQLADIGWTQEEGTMDQKQEWIMTPFSLVSGQQLERVGAGIPSTMGNRSQPGTPSSSAAEPMSPAPGVKRRPIFVPPLVSMLPDLASLVYDGDSGVANAARVAILDWMRHDPALIARPAFDAVSAKETSLHSAFSVLRGYLYAQSTLPPAMAHHTFNHLAGFLKYSARERNSEDTLTGFAYAVPLLSKLVAQVSDMSLRELRRAKIDAFLIPSGPLRVSSSTSVASAFPRSLSDVTSNSDEDPVHQLCKVVLVRVAQNLLFVNMLKRDRQEVQAFRKNMPRLVLPTTASTIAPTTELRSFLPNKQRTSSFTIGADADTSRLSLLLSRSYVLLVTEIFRSLPRHLNDRSELAVLIDGLNQILFIHGGDIGMVAHILIALMTASARFHRLFTSGGAYTLFIPALFKAYAEAESNEGVRRAIEYSINRFYAVHQEAFVFQVLNMLSQVVMLPGVDGPWIAKQIFLLLSILKDDAPVRAADAAGIHGSNRTQEQEAQMLRTAEEKPQALLTLLRRSSGSQGEDAGLAMPDQYDGHYLSLDNFIRLLLTVIGHDPSIRRAEQFLRLLRLMAPYFYDASPVAQRVLLEGIDAMGGIFITRSTGKTKVTENSQIRVEGSSNSFSQAASASIDAFETARSPSNFTEMKFDYLSLVAEFTKSGGSFGSSALRRILDLAKMMLRDSDPIGSERVASFLGSFAHNVLILNPSNLQLRNVLAFLNELGTIFKAHAGSTDFSKTLEVVLNLVENPAYANQPAFSQVVVTHFCASGLEVFEQLASDGLAFSTPLRPALVKLLCRATLLTGTDVVTLIERRPITFEFVAGILYPMALNLPSAAEIPSDTRWLEAGRRAANRRTWICLLQRAMQACQRQGPRSAGDRAEKASQPERKRSEKKTTVVKNYPAATLSMALQTLKVIVVKAEDELSAVLPSIWVQLGLLLKNVLSAGNARFAVSAHRSSVPTSPLQSPKDSKPRTSEDSDMFLLPPSPRVRSPAFQSPMPPQYPQPSLIDYLLWSILEYICRRRSPLMLQMRLFIQEATAILDEELNAQQSQAVRSRRSSYTSVFAKTPQKSGRGSRGPSPEASPFLTPFRPQGDVLLTPPKPERKPGYARSPTTPGGTEVTEPRIVHLGPVQNFDMFGRSPSPGLGDGGLRSRKWLMANSTTIRSTKLVLATYRRVRAVQRIMGYTGLILAPEGAEGSMDDVRVWSRGTALNEIEREAIDLMEFWSQDEE